MGRDRKKPKGSRTNERKSEGVSIPAVGEKPPPMETSQHSEVGTTGRYSRRKVASNWSRYDDKEDDDSVERESSRRPLLSIDDSVSSSGVATGTHFLFKEDAYMLESAEETSAYVSPLIDIDCSHLAESLSSIPMGKKLNIADKWLPADDSLLSHPLPSEKRASQRQRGNIPDLHQHISLNDLVARRDLQESYPAETDKDDDKPASLDTGKDDDKPASLDTGERVEAEKSDLETETTDLEQWLDSVI